MTIFVTEIVIEFFSERAVWACGEGQPDRQTDTQTRVTNKDFASSTTHAKCNNFIADHFGGPGTAVDPACVSV